MNETIFERTFNAIPILSKLKKHDLIDLVILTGSYVSETDDEQSDIDLFVVVPLQVEREYALASEYQHTLSVDGKTRTAEVSFVTTEKLTRDQVAKTHIFWWHNATVLFSKNSEILAMFNRASQYSQEEWLDVLWTLNFQYKLGMYDYEKITVRRPKDLVGSDIVYNDTLRIFFEFLMVKNKIIFRFTSFTRELSKTNPEVLEYLDSVAHEATIRKQAFQYCDEIVDASLLEAGFTQDQVTNWTQHGLARLTFQKY